MQGFKLMYCFLRVLRGCVCRWLSKTLSKQTSSECFWGADAGFQVDVLLPQSASGVCMQMVVQNIEQTNFLPQKHSEEVCLLNVLDNHLHTHPRSTLRKQVDVLLPQSASGVCMQMVVQNIAGFQVDVLLPQSASGVCMQMVETLSKQTSSECFWGADAGFQVDVLLPQSASGVCVQMVVQNIEQTNFLRVLLGCGCRVSS